MNARHLEFLRLVIESGSFSRAAQIAGVSQPAISQAMRALADELGAPLFERHGRRQAPTAEAIAVARAGHSVNIAMQEVARAGRRRPSSSDQRALRVGMAPAAGLLYSPLILDTLKRHDPASSLQIVTGSAPSMIRALSNGELDLVIAPKPRKSHYPGLASQLVYTSIPAIYARIGHAMAGARTLADIAKAEWVVAGVTGTPSNVIEEAFRVRHWAPPRITAQCSDYAMLIRIVACSDLLGVISHPALVPEPERLGIRPIEIREGLPHYDVCLFWGNDESQASRRWRRLIEAVREAVQSPA